jgi:hypothetical protein
MQTVFNSIGLNLKLKQPAQQEWGKSKKRIKENGNVCILLPFTYFTGSVHDPAFNIKNEQSNNQLFLKC